jgi:UDP-N-acetylmuramyl pentapeptide phosphotransferase/UDP-N-acetylglucosamine-1-phosphate transferase
MNLLIVILFALSAFVVSAWFTRQFCSPDSVVYILDQPNERSLHDRPMPRGGGVAIIIAIIVCGVAANFIYPVRDLIVIVSGMFVVAIVSFLDDRYSVPPLYRLAAHAVAAAAILYGGFLLQELEIPGIRWRWPDTVGAVFSLLFVVWMTNLYNFMDGMDGFAGGMAMFGFGAFAVMGWMVGHDTFFLLSLIIATASAGFLIFNFPPARIFMGDIGSSTLGLLAATLSLWGVRDGVFPFWIVLLVFSPFIVDATVTLARRLFRGERVWQAHKSHYYQKLVQAGWGHRRTVLLEYGIMLGCVMTAVWSAQAAPLAQIAVIAAWSVFYLGFFFWVTRRSLVDVSRSTESS